MEKMDVIKKLKALSDRGINGEKENATKLLNKLMKKYGITEEELEKSEVKTIWITLKNHAEVKICSQILYAHFENVSLWQRNGHRTKYWLELTPAQEIEFKYMLSVYLKSFYNEQEIFINAFIQKNQIFPINGPVIDISELTPEEREKAIKSSMMAQGIEKTRIRKALGN